MKPWSKQIPYSKNKIQFCSLYHPPTFTLTTVFVKTKNAHTFFNASKPFWPEYCKSLLLLLLLLQLLLLVFLTHILLLLYFVFNNCFLLRENYEGKKVLKNLPLKSTTTATTTTVCNLFEFCLLKEPNKTNNPTLFTSNHNSYNLLIGMVFFFRSRFNQPFISCTVSFCTWRFAMWHVKKNLNFRASKLGFFVGLVWHFFLFLKNKSLFG